jgi:hypothetical protein
MDTIKVAQFNQPVLDIDEKGFGLNRDRTPDRDWGELRWSKEMKEVESTPELRQKLLEDLAYTYGSDTIKFTGKLKEFKFI